ncbi:MAG: hypothetical protein AB1898_01810 [Acidobacteriota bacterium]
MKSKTLPGILAFLLLLTAGCSGPAVTSSNSTGLDESPGSAKMDLLRQNKEHVLVPGTVLRASLNHSLSTENNAPGDPFTMRVVDEVKLNDEVLVPIGSTIKGVVAESVRSGRVKGRAYMSLKFSELVLPNGKVYALQASSLSRRAPATKKKDAMIIGGGAGVGTAIGAIAGGGKGAAIGAAAGAGAGTGAVLATRGKETGFSSGTTLNVKLTEPLKLQG